MYSSIRPLYHQMWIIVVSVICQSVLVQSCRSSIKDPMLGKEHENKIRPQEKFENDVKLESFSEYLKSFYHFNLTSFEINFIMEKWKEFDEYYYLIPNSINNVGKLLQNSKDSFEKQCPCNNRVKINRKQLRKRIIKQKFSKSLLPPSLSDLQHLINNQGDTNLLINIKASNRKKKDVVHRRHANRVFSKYEAKLAWNATYRFEKPESGACKIHNKSFCMEKYFSIKPENKDLIYFYPPSITVQRCSQDRCQCLRSNQECMPTSTKYRLYYVMAHDEKFQLWTWAFYVTDHVQCKCQPRCFMRKCVEPFRLRVFNKGNGVQSCECSCPVGKERKCNQIITGKTKFSKLDYKCIASGKCLKPECINHSLSEENLYDRRCSR